MGQADGHGFFNWVYLLFSYKKIQQKNDTAHGDIIFIRSCAGCHWMDYGKERIGA